MTRLRVSGSESPSPLQKVPIGGTVVLSQVFQFWDSIRGKLAYESFYIVNIRAMRMRLLELQDNEKKVKKLRLEGHWLLNGWEDIEQMLNYQGHTYVPKVISLELINKHHDNTFIGQFKVEKTWELIARKYYWAMLWRDVQTYVQSCNVCLALKAVEYKSYRDLQSLLMPNHW